MIIDFIRVSLLLGVIDKVGVLCPQFGHISAAAMGELKTMNDQIELSVGKTDTAVDAVLESGVVPTPVTP